MIFLFLEKIKFLAIFHFLKTNQFLQKDKISKMVQQTQQWFILLQK
jgi:hypothetical protein